VISRSTLCKVRFTIGLMGSIRSVLTGLGVLALLLASACGSDDEAGGGSGGVSGACSAAGSSGGGGSAATAGGAGNSGQPAAQAAEVARCPTTSTQAAGLRSGGTKTTETSGPMFRTAARCLQARGLMQENRSFGEYFPAPEYGVTDGTSRPTRIQLRLTINRRKRSAAIDPRCVVDVNHEWNSVHIGTTTARWTDSSRPAIGRCRTMGYRSDGPSYYYWMAKTFAMSDRHFARSVPWPNRFCTAHRLGQHQDRRSGVPAESVSGDDEHQRQDHGPDGAGRNSGIYRDSLTSFAIVFKQSTPPTARSRGSNRRDQRHAAELGDHRPAFLRWAERQYRQRP
jgi:hypothetical protein